MSESNSSARPANVCAHCKRSYPRPSGKAAAGSKYCAVDCRQAAKAVRRVACGFDGCLKPAKGRLCSGHSEQRRLGRDLTPLKKKLPNGVTEECSFEACDKTAEGNGLCWGHIEQDRKGQPLRPLGKRHPTGTGYLRDDLGRKRCHDCLEWLEIEHFGRVTGKGDGFTTQCRRCRRMYAIARKYGLSADRYEQIIQDQGFECAVCRRPLEDRGHLVAVDHDHDCCSPRGVACGRCVRGVLCMACNTSLGGMKDDPDRLLRAAAYLVGWSDVARRMEELEQEDRASGRLAVTDSPGDHRTRLRPVPVDREQRPVPRARD